ncbi:MAG: hypothetical protein ACKVHP_25415, partial [Verrucomicrobiales bacterium]
YTVVDAAGIQSSAIIEIILPFRVDTLLESGASVCYIVPSSNVNDTTWMLPEFDASEWTTGVTGLGYDNNADFLPEIATTIDGLRGVNTSLFVRVPFQGTDVNQYTQLGLRMKIDDGFVAYING